MNSIAQLASERTSLTLFAQAPSTISFVPLTRNLSPAAPFPTPSKALGTKNRLLRYGICVPCQKRLPLVRDAFSEAFGARNRLFRYRNDIRCTKTPFWGTRRIFRSSPCSKQASTVRERYSVPKTPSYGTEGTLGAQKQHPEVRDAFSETLRAQNRLLGYRRDIRYRKRLPVVRNEATGYDYCERVLVGRCGHYQQPDSPKPHKLTKPAKSALPHKSQKADRLTSANPQTLY